MLKARWNEPDAPHSIYTRGLSFCMRPNRRGCHGNGAMFVTSQTLKYIWSIRADLRNGEVFFKTTMMKGMQDCMHAGFYILETCQVSNAA